jgi:hypothetical protein
VLPWIVCSAPLLWSGVTLPADASEQEVYAIVREAGTENRKGRRVYSDTLYLMPSEKRSAVLELCGMVFFGYPENVEKLRSHRRDGHTVTVYKSTVDPATRNTRREAICLSGG